MGRHPAYTIADVVRIAQVTERTVRRDIASGRLRSVKLPNGHRRFKVADIEKYRCSRALRKPHMKLEEFARLIDVSLRTLRRYLASGRYPVPVIHASARRHYMSHSMVARLARSPVEALERRAVELERAAREGGSSPRPSPPASSPPASSRPDSEWSFLLVPGVAMLARRTVRQVYHDIEKGALPVCRRGRRILVRVGEAERYAGRRWSSPSTLTNGDKHS